MKLGFTGTRQGMTDAQRTTIQWILAHLKPSEVHHGNAIGADEQFADLAGGLRQVSHPCNIPGQQSNRTAPDEIRPVKPPLDRNRDIVDETDLLMVCSATDDEVQKSGTWATARYAARQQKPQVIVYPSGGWEAPRNILELLGVFDEPAGGS